MLRNSVVAVATWISRLTAMSLPFPEGVVVESAGTKLVTIPKKKYAR